MRISERGQITIPKKIRDQFGLRENTEVEFIVRDGRVEIRPGRKSRRDMVDTIYGRKRFKHSTDELMELLRK